MKKSVKRLYKLFCFETGCSYVGQVKHQVLSPTEYFSLQSAMITRTTMTFNNVLFIWLFCLFSMKEYMFSCLLSIFYIEPLIIAQSLSVQLV